MTSDSDISPIKKRRGRPTILPSSPSSSDDDFDIPLRKRKFRPRVSSSSDSDDSIIITHTQKKLRALPESESESYESTDSEIYQAFRSSKNMRSKSRAILSASDSEEGNGSQENSGKITESGSNSSDEETERCIICFKSFRGSFARPSGCQHKFHSECILTWSKNSNTCPIDRVKYTDIVVISTSGAFVRRHEVCTPPPANFGNDIEPDDPTFCEVCLQHDREDEMLLCDRCEAGYHLNCLSPPLAEVPYGDWFCPGCAANASSDSDGESEICEIDDDDEVNDLLRESIQLDRRTRQRQRHDVAPRIGPRTRAVQRVISSIRQMAEETFMQQPSSSNSRPSTSRRRRRRRSNPGRSTHYKVELVTVEDGSTVEVKIAVNTRKTRKKISKKKRKNNSSSCSRRMRTSSYKRTAPISGGSSENQRMSTHNNPFRRLDIFGSRPQLEYFSGGEAEDELDEDGGLSMLRAARTVGGVRGMANRKQIAAQILRTAPRRPPRRISFSSAPPDLVSSILNEQTKWHTPNAIINSNSNGEVKVTLPGKSSSLPVKKCAGNGPGVSGSSSSAGGSNSGSPVKDATISRSEGEGSSGVPPLQPPPQPPVFSRGYEDEDFDLYADIEPPLVPPPEPPALLLALEGEEAVSSPEDAMLVIDDRQTYDPDVPTSPPLSPSPSDKPESRNEEIKSNEKETKKKSVHPPIDLSAIRLPSPELEIDDCPNRFMYSATSVNIAQANSDSESDKEIDISNPSDMISKINLEPITRSNSGIKISSSRTILPFKKSIVKEQFHVKKIQVSECTHSILEKGDTDKEKIEGSSEEKVEESVKEKSEEYKFENPDTEKIEDSVEEKAEECEKYDPEVISDDDDAKETVNEVSISSEAELQGDISKESDIFDNEQCKKEESIDNKNIVKEKDSNLVYSDNSVIDEMTKLQEVQKDSNMSKKEYKAEDQSVLLDTENEKVKVEGNDAKEEGNQIKHLENVIAYEEPQIKNEDDQITEKKPLLKDEVLTDDKEFFMKDEENKSVENQSDKADLSNESKMEEDQVEVDEVEKVNEKNTSDRNNLESIKNELQDLKAAEEGTNDYGETGNENLIMTMSEKEGSETDSSIISDQREKDIESDDENNKKIELNDLTEIQATSEANSNKKRDGGSSTDSTPPRKPREAGGDKDDQEGEDVLELGCGEERDGLVDITDEEISSYEKSWELENKEGIAKSAGLEGLETEAISDCEYNLGEVGQTLHKLALIENGSKEEGEILNDGKKSPVSWKKITKAKERSYREKDPSKEKTKKKEKKPKEKRKELERYDVRKIISDKPKKRRVDEFGRDISPSRSRSLSDSRSRSIRSRSLSIRSFRSVRSRRSRSRSRSKKRRSRDRRSRNRSKGRSRGRSRSVGRSRIRSRDRSRKKGKSKSRSRSVSRRRRSKTPKKSKDRRSRAKSREKKKRKRDSSISCSSCSCSSCDRERRKAKKLTITVPNKPTGSGKEKKKNKYKDRSEPKRRRGDSPVPSKEVFTSGDNILVSVNFKASKSGESGRKESSKKKKDDEPKRKKDKTSKENQPLRSIVSKTSSNQIEGRRKRINAKNLKPVAIIDLAQSPFREQTLSPKEVIVLTDSDGEDKRKSNDNSLTTCQGTGPKTPPEPHIKFNIINSKPQIRSLANPLLDSGDQMEGEVEEDERIEIPPHKGPNTPPEPPVPYDPFEPTKSRSPTPLQELEEIRNPPTPPGDNIIPPEPIQRPASPPKPPPETPKTPSPLHSPPPKPPLEDDSPEKAHISPPNNCNDDSMDMGGGDSPYSPGSSDAEDIFEPPLPQLTTPVPIPKTKPRNNQKHIQKLTPSPLKRKPGTKTSTPLKSSKGKKESVGMKLDEDQLKILDDLPNSAVEMQVKDKFLKKLNRQERVVEEVKMVLKPHYAKKHVTKEEYKEILRKSVPKICHSRSGEINPMKIQRLIEAYVKKYRHLRKKRKMTNFSAPDPIALFKPKPKATMWC